MQSIRKGTEGAPECVSMLSPLRISNGSGTGEIAADPAIGATESGSDTVLLDFKGRGDIGQFCHHAPLALMTGGSSIRSNQPAESVLTFANFFTAQSTNMRERGADLMIVFRRVIGGRRFGFVPAGKSLSDDKVKSVVHMPVPPLAEMDFRGMSGYIVRIPGGPEMTLYDLDEIAGSLMNDPDPYAAIIWVAGPYDEMKGYTRVSAIMFGIPESGIGSLIRGTADYASVFEVPPLLP